MKSRWILLVCAALMVGIVGCGSSDDSQLSEADKKKQEDYLKNGIKFDENGQAKTADPTAVK